MSRARPGCLSVDLALDPAARALYLAVVADGGWVKSAEVPTADADALGRLLEIGLLRGLPGGAFYSAVSPRAFLGRTTHQLRGRAVGLLRQADELPALLDELAQAYDSAPRRIDRTGVVETVQDRDSIRHRIAQLVADTEAEILTAQPGGDRAPDHLAWAMAQDVPFLRAGGMMRTLYQPVARVDPATTAYAAAVTPYGARIRVLDEDFQRMLIFDRAVAVIPASVDMGSAAFVADPTAVELLVELFERDWQRAQRVAWGSAHAVADSGAVADRIARLLAGGLSRRGIAARLGLSERTVAAHIARLRQDYEAQTLFQLGWLMRGAGEGRPDEAGPAAVRSAAPGAAGGRAGRGGRAGAAEEG
ncbi:LuxR C-terminal-related transcriptional regulator [Kitasatospora sp. NBC_01287]|uniref:LuxR C-terminal-related transcriptional regulator n=1 Tax=Kitasatospora sp. NBC_01287 TaxID=2903573 RepID=UPI0022521386|nr:LuxR C-terminal-related transcriptional regulator [Kitasatospora sp. NBC_01287]MCX4747565.1 LuxR C-terminal-related transcriptional regulator [Kitasatospora sp. NBC_01287]